MSDKNQKLKDELGDVVPVWLVGDALKGGKAREAILLGYKIGLRL